MKILVVGAGMYVTGRGRSGPGTILSSLAESSRELPIDEVIVAVRTPQSQADVAEAAARINATIGTSLEVSCRLITGEPAVDVPRLAAEHGMRAAIVSIPDHLHFAWSASLLEAGLHTLVVKPLVPTLAEARELEEIRRRRCLHAAVEFHKRWDATNLWIKKALAGCQLGKIQYVSVDYSQKISIPLDIFRSWSARTNIFQYLGVHYVDLIWFLTGFIPVRAMAVGTDGVLRQKGVGTWDSIHASVIWRNPNDAGDVFVSCFNTNWIDPVCTTAMSDQRYRIVGTAGRIECDQKNRGLEFVHETVGVQHVNPYFSEYLPGPDGRVRFQGYGHQSIDQFVRDVVGLMQGGINLTSLESCRPTIRQSLVSTAVIEAVNRSLAEGFVWKEIHEIF